MTLLWVVGASLFVSLLSLIGIITFILKERWLNKVLIVLIAFSAGGLIGGAFLHLMPEALKLTSPSSAFLVLIVGFVLFFLMERFFYWRHCHNGKCDVHPFTYLILIGDGVHNFIDGIVMGASFFVSIHFGLVTTLIIILHEIPQELGDFGVLVYGGLNKYKALFYNLLSGLTAVLGALAGYFFTQQAQVSTPFILPFAAGGFIYIASCDLIPEIRKQTDSRRVLFSMLFFILGIALILAVKTVH
jgi:zinc and cadmium transporter